MKKRKLPPCNNPRKNMDNAARDDLLISSNHEQIPTTSTEIKHDKSGQLNPDIPPFTMDVTPQHNVSEEHCLSNPGAGADNNNAGDQSATTSPFVNTHQSDTTLQEIIKLQTKQAELTAIIAEQQ